ncbi:MAG TPA: LPS export ABC transporter periplasmic protein LptC [Thermodesulfovibrionales bacterium]|nr:LPS export ABC transporter periplasmic protein LptC [Thermodesulfovibrionales bacterium]
MTALFTGGRKLLWGLVSILSIFIFFVMFYGEREYKTGFSVSKGNSFMEGLRIVNKKDGSDSWSVTAGRADFSKDETVAHIAAVTIDLKKEGAVLKADSGTYNMKKHDLRLEKNITLRLKDATISTESLTWDPAGKMLSADGRIRMQGDKFRIEGEGLTATQDNKVKLARNVKAIFF